MSDKINKTLSFDIPEDCWVKLKVLSIQKRTTLPKLCKDIMEKFVSGKRGNALEQQIDQTDV
jgi:hypothetical protein